LLPLCHHLRRNPLYKGEKGWWQMVGEWQQGPQPSQPHPLPLPDREGGGCAQGGDGRITAVQHEVTAFQREITAFSVRENSVFSTGKRCFHVGDNFLGEELGVGPTGSFAATLPPSATTPHVSVIQRFRKIGGRVAAKSRKKNMYTKTQKHEGSSVPLCFSLFKKG